MITGAAKVAGVVGWPVAHSLSPLIHNAWINALGLDAVYVPLSVPVGGFREFVASVRESNLYGLNVTLPHKLEALRSADTWSDSAWRSQAANVLLFDDDSSVHAENTDGHGLLDALETAGWDAGTGPCTIIGSGGAAQGAAAALIDAGCRSVRLAARKPGRAAVLARELSSYDSGGPLRGYDFNQLWAALDGTTAIINATSAGLKGQGSLPPMDAPAGAVFMDMVYSPLRTPFLQAAAARGHPTVDGLAMLIGQARPSFELFFGVAPPPPEVVDVRALCLKALGEA